MAAVADAWTGPSFAPVAMLPELVHLDDVPAVAVDGAGSGGGGIPIGLDEEGLAPVAVDLGADPHLVCFADAESGKTTLLRVVAHGLVARYAPDELRIVVVDYRRGLLGAVPAAHLLAYASSADAAAEAAHDIAASLRGRLPGPTVGQRELRERSWWSGPEVVVLVDDYDLVAPRWRGRPPAAAAPGVPAAGQGRRPARGRHPALRRGVPGAVRSVARSAPRARRSRGW